MKKVAAIVLVMLVAVILTSRSVSAQATASGTVQGTVVDASGAAVVEAQVTLRNRGTGATKTATTNDTGFYRFELLPVGSYVVRVVKEGFTAFEITGDVAVGQTSTFNADLKVGSSSQTVEVSGTIPVADVTKTDVSVNIAPAEVEQLPMLGRDVASLAMLAPGVRAADSYDPTKNRYAVISVNGQGGRNINVTVNGVDNKDNTVGGTVMQLPLEAVEEFKISTQRFSAANGRSEGAAINMITKSGSNTPHGSFFGFFREKQFNAADELSGTSAPYSRQFFGGSIGAPIKKDKFFGFFAIERQRENTQQSESPDAYQQLLLVTDLGAQPSALIPRPFFEWRYNGRLVYNINNSNHAYLSYTSQSNDSLNDQSDGLGDLTGGNFTKNHLQIANFTLDSSISPTLTNSFTLGYQFWNNIIDSSIVAPYVTFASVSEWFGTNTNVPQESFQRKWQFKDDVVKRIGNHSLQFGVDFINTPVFGGFFKSNSTLEIDFQDDPTTITTNATLYPQQFATPGAVTGMSLSAGDPYFLIEGKQLGLFVQDDWKVTSRLSLNLGLRWDRDFNFNGASAIPDSRTFQYLQAINSPLASGIPHDDTKDFSPRVGFAYDLTGQGKHVLRGGFGLYYGNTYENIPLFMIQQANTTVYQGVFSISSPGEEVPGTGIALGAWRYGVDPFPVAPPPSGDLANGATGRLMDPKYRNPVSEEFNVGYQWALDTNSVVEAEYVHVLGLHMNRTITSNLVVPGVPGRPLDAEFDAAGVPRLGSIREEESIGRMRYDGLNLSYRRRLSRRFSVNANYTLSRSVGWGVTADGFRNYPHDARDPWNVLDFGNTPNDERHHISISSIVQLPWGFQVAPILQYGSARPYDLTSSFDPLGIGSGYQRPSIVPVDNPTDYLTYGVGALANSASTEACLAAGTCRQAGYDTVRGNYFFQLDARVSKYIKLGERAKVELMFQAFNLTNHANFGANFGNSASSGTFLKPQGYINPNLSPGVQARAFVGEFGARFVF